MASDSSTAKAVRAHETRSVIGAPIEDVWKALTDAKEIARWFAPEMTVEPGAGGFVLADWGPGLVWKTAIEVWEPNRHLRLVETRDHMPTPPGVEQTMAPCRLIQDYYLEAEGGKTVLRLVHSGFGSSSDWDGEYESTRGGWAICFLRLKHGLERHRHDSVHNRMWTAMCYGIDHVCALHMVESAAPQPMEIVLRGDRHVCSVLPELNGSLFSASVGPSSADSLAHVQLLLFGMSDAQEATISNEWRAKLARLFPPSPGN